MPAPPTPPTPPPSERFDCNTISEAEDSSRHFASLLCANTTILDYISAMQPSMGPQETDILLRKLLNCRANVCRHCDEFIRMAPQYILLGAPKCASSSLHNYLQAHPSLQVAGHTKVVPMWFTPWRTTSEPHLGVAVNRHSNMKSNVTSTAGWTAVPADAATSWMSMCMARNLFGYHTDGRNGPQQPLLQINQSNVVPT